MRRPSRQIVVLLLVWVSLAETAAADSFRCGRRVVRDGDSAAEVLERCGEPRARETGQETIWLANGQQRVRVVRWRYRTGARRLERVVLLYRGEVVGIRSGGR